MVRENKVKQKLKNGEAVIGTFVKTVDPSVIEILGCSGMEFFVIDSEHVSYNPETITDLVRASDLTGIVPIVRVREATAVNIMQALDTGALGYHAPNVDTPEQARIAVDAGRYTPLGNRGFAPTTSCSRTFMFRSRITGSSLWRHPPTYWENEIIRCSTDNMTCFSSKTTSYTTNLCHGTGDFTDGPGPGPADGSAYPR